MNLSIFNLKNTEIKNIFWGHYVKDKSCPVRHASSTNESTLDTLKYLGLEYDLLISFTSKKWGISIKMVKYLYWFFSVLFHSPFFFFFTVSVSSFLSFIPLSFSRARTSFSVFLVFYLLFCYMFLHFICIFEPVAYFSD